MSVPPLYTLSFSLPAWAEAVDGGGKLKGNGSRTEWEQSHEAEQLLSSEENRSYIPDLGEQWMPDYSQYVADWNKLYEPVLNSLAYGWNQWSTFATSIYSIFSVLSDIYVGTYVRIEYGLVQ